MITLRKNSISGDEAALASRFELREVVSRIEIFEDLPEPIATTYFERFTKFLPTSIYQILVKHGRSKSFRLLFVVGICSLLSGCVFHQRWRTVEIKNSRADAVVLYVDGDHASGAIAPGATFRTLETHLRGGAMRLEARDKSGKRVLERLDLIDSELDRADDGGTIRAVFSGLSSQR